MSMTTPDADLVFDNHIGGRAVPARGGHRFAAINPTTGAEWGRFADSGGDDVNAAVQAAHDALAGPWGQLSATRRGRLLMAWGEKIAGRAEVIAELETLAKAQTQGSLVQAYHLASGVLDLAGTFEEEALCEAANSLCDLVVLFGKGTPDWASVAVHVSALKLIRQADGQGVEAVLEGLRECVQEKGHGRGGE